MILLNQWTLNQWTGNESIEIVGHGNNLKFFGLIKKSY